VKTSEVLRKAGDVLRERGWHQGWFYNRETGAVCVLGACHLAVSGCPDSNAAIQFLGPLDTVIDASLGGGRAFWNDAEGRTADDAIQALDAAYVLALQEEGIEPGDVL
jgi:hypothetical protein